MGIKGLTKLIDDNAPDCIKEHKIENYFNRVIAIDASMSIYQFLIAVRQGADMLANAEGEVTSHIAGIFYRTVRLIENGIKPVYVFDGKPPTMKSGELAKRKVRREEAAADLEEAKETGEQEDIDKFSKRLVKVSPQQMNDCKEVLRMMGIPVVNAPCEAEAQCAELCRAKRVYATATEDMDSLTFRTPVLLRYLTYPEAKKKPILQIEVETVMKNLELSYEQFVDLCILCGCDYCETIPKVGPVTALKLIRQHKNIENIIKAFKKEEKEVPEDWPFDEARKLFTDPDVTSSDEIPEFKWTNCQEEELIAFMCDKHGFNKERIQSGIARLKKGKEKGSQNRLENFFGPATVVSSTSNKRQIDDAKSKKADTKKFKSNNNNGSNNNNNDKKK